MTRKYEYHEGPRARKDFEGAMSALFKAPKTVRVGQGSAAAKKKASRPADRKKKRGDAD